MSYITGFLLAVPNANREAYVEMARKGWEMFREYGCLGMQENWGVDVPDGKVTSFPMSVKKAEDETVVFSWMVWPDKATADKAWSAMMQDPRMEAMGQMPFDGQRMMWGGFEPVASFGQMA
jgi:uncharacterized protein YbaA (DUF1428 family)